MKITLVSILALAAIGAAAAPAAAQSYLPLSQRQANLDTRIDAGVRTGELTRAEAVRLRAEFRDLLSAETAYRRSGGVLDARERADLDRRFDLLDARIRYDRNDEQDRDEVNDYDTRQDRLAERIDRGVARGDLTREEAQSLRSELRALVRLETQFERTGGGLDARERADLDRRYDALAERLRFERRDGDDRDDGYSNYVPLEQRRAELERRIGAATRNGGLSLIEAVRIRAEFSVLVRQENTYRTSGNGLDATEEQALQRRYDELSARIRDERRDDDRRY